MEATTIEQQIRELRTSISSLEHLTALPDASPTAETPPKLPNEGPNFANHLSATLNAQQIVLKSLFGDLSTNPAPKEQESDATALRSFLTEVTQKQTEIEGSLAGARSTLSSLEERLSATGQQDQQNLTAVAHLRGTWQVCDDHFRAPDSPFRKAEFLSLGLRLLELRRQVISSKSNFNETIDRLNEAVSQSQKDALPWPEAQSVIESLEGLEAPLRETLGTILAITEQTDDLRELIDEGESSGRFVDVDFLQTRLTKHEDALRSYATTVANAHRKAQATYDALHRSDMRRIFKLALSLLQKPLEAGGSLYTLLTLAGLLYVCTLSWKAGIGLQLLSSISDLQSFLVLGVVYAAPSFPIIMLAFAWYLNERRIIRRVPTTSAQFSASVTVQDLENALRSPLQVPWRFRRGRQLAVLAGWLLLILTTPPALAWVTFQSGEPLRIRLDDGTEIANQHQVFVGGGSAWFIGDGRVYRVPASRLVCVRAMSPRVDSNDPFSDSRASLTVQNALDEPLTDHCDRPKRPPGSDEQASFALLQFTLERGLDGLFQALRFAAPGEAHLNFAFSACTDRGSAKPLASFFFDTGSHIPNSYTLADGLEARAIRADAQPGPGDSLEASANTVLAILNGLGITVEDSPLLLVGFASRAGSIEENFMLAERRVETVARAFGRIGLSVSYLPVGEPWSNTYLLQRPLSPPTPENDPSERVVHLYLCKRPVTELAGLQH